MKEPLKQTESDIECYAKPDKPRTVGRVVIDKRIIEENLGSLKEELLLESLRKREKRRIDFWKNIHPGKGAVTPMKDEPSKAESLKQKFEALFFEIDQLETKTEKSEVLAVVKSCLDSFQKSSTSAFLTLPSPTDNYERYQPRTDALEHLQRVWGRYLTYFGAKEDVLYQQDLRRLDEGLMSAICSQIKYKNKTGKMEDKVADVIKPMKEKVKKQVIGLSEEEIKKSGRIYKAAYKYSPVYHS